MKKSNLFQDALEREIQDLLAPYPDPMGRTDFRKACRIGTRTSIYLLQSGLVPCENTGKQTRCYKIAKADVAAYLRRRLAEPAYYTPPSGWYKNYPAHKPPAFGLNGALLLTDTTRRRVRRWYENLLARRAGRPPDRPHHRLRLPHRQPLVYRGEVKGVPVSTHL